MFLAFTKLLFEAQLGDRHGELVGEALPKGDVFRCKASDVSVV